MSTTGWHTPSLRVAHAVIVVFSVNAFFCREVVSFRDVGAGQEGSFRFQLDRDELLLLSWGFVSRLRWWGQAPVTFFIDRRLVSRLGCLWWAVRWLRRRGRGLFITWVLFFQSSTLVF